MDTIVKTENSSKIGQIEINTYPPPFPAFLPNTHKKRTLLIFFLSRILYFTRLIYIPVGQKFGSRFYLAVFNVFDFFFFCFIVASLFFFLC